MVWYVDFILYFWGLFQSWLNLLFVTPFQNVNMLWLLVPVWLGWFFAEFFQEKFGTSMGNAMSNAVIIIWASIDCTRQTVSLITQGLLLGAGNIILRFSLLSLLLIYGITLIILGWRGNKIIEKIGRIREVTYLFVVLIPVFYNVIPFSIEYLISIILFFPLFYFVIELMDRYAPNPLPVKEDIEEATELGEREGYGQGKMSRELTEFDHSK